MKYYISIDFEKLLYTFDNLDRAIIEYYRLNKSEYKNVIEVKNWFLKCLDDNIQGISTEREKFAYILSTVY